MVELANSGEVRPAPATDAMKVGYVLKRYPRYSETFVVNEILAHEAAGLGVEIFALRPPSDTHFQDAISRVRAPVTYLPASGIRAPEFWAALEEAAELLPDLWPELEAARGAEGRDVCQAALLARTVAEKGITHLHAHFGTSAASVARLAARFAGIPYTFTAHAKDIFHDEVDPVDLGRKLREAAATVTVSDYNVEYLRERFAAPNLHRVFNGLDLENFPYRPAAGRPPKVLAVGRLVEKKGFADLISACRILADRGVGFSCRIIGTGELQEDLQAQIVDLGLEGVVELAGPRPQREVVREIQGAAAFAAPCVLGSDGNRDGLPTVLLESMALGTPCVSTKVTGIPEVLLHEKTGLMVPQHEPAALAAALERLIRDELLRLRLAENARRLIETDFDVHRNAAALREVFAAASRDVLPLSEAR